MNPLIEEYLIDEHRQDIKREMSHIRLEEQALKSRVSRPNLFTRAMRIIGKSLIVQGEKLVKQYEIPAEKPLFKINLRDNA